MVEKIKNYLETIKVTPISWILGISGVLMVRFFLESLSNPTSTGLFASDSSTLVHYYLFFMCIFVFLMILFRLSMPGWANLAPQFVVISSVIVWAAPLLDWIISGGNGFRMSYFFDTPNKFIIRFLTFGGTDVFNGATIGLRIEIAVAIILFGILVFLVRKSLLKAILFPLILYSAIIVFALIPSIIAIFSQHEEKAVDPIVFLINSTKESSTILNNLHGTLDYGSATRVFEVSFNFIMGKILFLILIALSVLWFAITQKTKLLAVVKNMRPERVAHYFLMILLGALVAFLVSPGISFNWNDWLSLLMLFLSFTFSILFAISSNDVIDEDIDKISESSRPLITGKLNKQDMRQIGVMGLIASLISGFIAGYTSLFFVMTFTALYFIYSVPPTRYKLIPFFSSFIISLCALVAVISGFFLVSVNKQVSAFPDRFIAGIVLIFFLGSHIRDMKDIDGDASIGVKTVPVLFGKVWGPRVVGIFASTAFVLVPVFLKSVALFIVSIPAALVVYLLVNRKPYKEKYIFYTYFAFFFVALLILKLNM